MTEDSVANDKSFFACAEVVFFSTRLRELRFSSNLGQRAGSLGVTLGVRV
jgi:hypothetical protein